MNALRLAPFAVLLVLLGGCGSNDKPTGPVPTSDGLPAGTPAADSPAHLATRLEATWESQVVTEYAKLLTSDFRYRFSADADPILVGQYPNWGPDDEVTSMRHLFEGFTNSSNVPVPAASRIDLSFAGVSFQDDPDHADSTAHYRRLIITNLDGLIEVPEADETISYNISARHELYLVRGDAAVLTTGSRADASRWYVRRWDDLAVNPAARKGPVVQATQPKTLGSLKAQFR